MIGQNSKLYSIILFSLLGVSGLLYLLFIVEAIDGSMLLNWCFLLFGIATLVAIVFPLIGMAKDFKRAKSSLIGVGALILIFVISLAMSSEEVYKVGENVVEGAVTQRSEAGLITFYILIVLAIGSIVFTEISKAFK